MGNGFQVLCYISSLKQVTSYFFKKLASSLIFDRLLPSHKSPIAILQFQVTVTILVLQSNGVTVPLRNYLLFLVTSKYFVTFKISITSNFYGTVTMKNGERIKSSELLLQVTEVK